MALRIAAILALALVAMAQTAPLVTRQADRTLEPKDMAAVRRIRSLIEERARVKDNPSIPAAERRRLRNRRD